MDGITGIEAARQIRKDNKECYFAFISSYDNNLRELFGINTVAFIDKPFAEEQIKYVIDKVYEQIFDIDNKIFTFSYKGLKRFVYLKDIVFFESLGHQISLVIKNDQYVFNNRLKNIWNNLITSTEFVMPHKSYIVNLNIQQNNDNLYINISNNYSGNLKFIDEMPVSFKNALFHGIGLKTIKTIAERYDGIVSINAENNNFEIEIIMFSAFK